MKIVEETNGTENNSSKIHYVPNADVISLETIVNMMVNKGICTADELFMLEGNVQELNSNDKKSHNFIHKKRLKPYHIQSF
jgi:hypothetical protein